MNILQELGPEWMSVDDADFEIPDPEDVNPDGSIVKRSAVNVPLLRRQIDRAKATADLTDKSPEERGLQTTYIAGRMVLALEPRDKAGVGPIYDAMFCGYDVKDKKWISGWVILCINTKTGEGIEIGYAAAASPRSITQAHIKHVLRAILQDNQLRFDEVKREVMLNNKVFSPDEIPNLTYDLSDLYGVNFPINMRKVVGALAQENTYNSFREEFDRIEKEVEPGCFEAFCQEVLRITDPVSIAKFRLQFIATVIRAGGYTDQDGKLLYWRNFLVLIAAQNVGKDVLVRDLFDGHISTAPPTPKLDVREAAKSMNKGMVIRFGEVNRFVRSSKDLETLKDWAAVENITYTDKWMIGDTTEPKRFTCWASSNDYKWMNDPTGNTRFWNINLPFEESEPIDFDLVRKYREGLFALAIQFARQFEKGEFNPWTCDDYETIKDGMKEEKSSYEMDSPYVDKLQDALKNHEEIKILTTAQLSQILGEPETSFNRRGAVKTETQMALKELGFSVETFNLKFENCPTVKPYRRCYVRAKDPRKLKLDWNRDYKRKFNALP